ncbi:MAG TPA: PH domain-containing protein [Micromonosporaceae bacterium]|nr:PH domain-containing protein [Micromonosporaceae bacterium]
MQPSLRAPLNLVDRRAISYWTVRDLPGWLILGAVQVIWWVGDTAHGAWHATFLIATGIVAIAHILIMPRWRYRVHRWETTDEAVYTQTGWFTQERRIAPISRIQTVDMHRGPLEQVFGLANVTVTTASAAGPLKIHGLRRAHAERLVHELTTVTQATKGDAT